MSQIPPGFPPNNPQGYPPGNYPPQNYPPQNFPPQPGFGPQGYSLPSAARTSGAAVASLVCGLVFCIPGITGLVAVITGIIGIAQTRSPVYRGRGMAIAGLILGILSLVGWSTIGGGALIAYQAAKPQRDFAKAYISDLAAGKIDQCAQNSTGSVTQDVINAQYQKMQGWGAPLDTTVFAFTINNNNGQISGAAAGMCKFTNGPHSFAMKLLKDSSGQYKVSDFQWQN